MSSAPEALPARRPNLSRWVRELIRDVARTLPELAHVRSSAVLVVAGEARRASRATIRPTRFAETATLHSADGRWRKPRLSFKGKEIRYVMTLRPLFFQRSSAAQRVETVIHELFHLSSRFDGTLDPARRHAVMGEAFEAQLRPLVQRYLSNCDPQIVERFSFDGEVLVRQWLEKPPRLLRLGSGQRRRYDESQTFLGPVLIKTGERG